MAAEKLKSVKISESVHTALKVFVAEKKWRNITSFVDSAILNEITSLKKTVKPKTK